MRTIVLFLIAFALSLPVAATEPKVVDPVDFIVDAPSMVGQRVTISTCSLFSASAHGMLCGFGALGSVSVDVRTLDREQFRRALRQCQGRPSETCEVALTGTISVEHGMATMKDVVLKWVR
jgi:hypothetical protein